MRNHHVLRHGMARGALALVIDVSAEAMSSYRVWYCLRLWQIVAKSGESVANHHRMALSVSVASGVKKHSRKRGVLRGDDRKAARLINLWP